MPWGPHVLPRPPAHTHTRAGFVGPEDGLHDKAGLPGGEGGLGTWMVAPMGRDGARGDMNTGDQGPRKGASPRGSWSQQGGSWGS